VDSTGQTIDFLLTAPRDTAAAKCFFRPVFQTPGHSSPRVIHVDKNAAYPAPSEDGKRKACCRNEHDYDNETNVLTLGANRLRTAKRCSH
jgi:transposase-like protein